MNIEEVKFDILNLKFSVHHDHSKWAVTSFSDNVAGQKVKIACIGDINRQEEQFKRSGGTVCFLNNENVWKQYSYIVNDVEQCKKFKVNSIKIRKFSDKNSSEKIILLGR